MATTAMTRAELLERLRRVGYPVQPYRLDYLVATGLVTAPPIRSGRRLYSEQHLRQVMAAEQERRR